MGYYCTVPQCTSLAGKTKNVKFHRFPRDVTMADKWNLILKRGKPYTKYSKVCSLHFTQSDYNVTTMGQWKTLSKDAVPSQNLPKLHADGTVMVIRKSRTANKYREVKREEGIEKDKWLMATPTHAGLPLCNSQDTQVGSSDLQDANLNFRLQTLSAIASSIPHHPPHTPPTPHPLPHQTLSMHTKPKKQDAIMQTDPVQSEEDDTQPSGGSEGVAEPPGYPYPKTTDSFEKKYEGPKDYTKTEEDFIPRTNEEYNSEAEKYALERKSHNPYEKQDSYPKSVQMDSYQKLDLYPNFNDKIYTNRPESWYQNGGYVPGAEGARAQFDAHVKREGLDDAERPPEHADCGLYAAERRLQQQRLMEQLSHQVKQEPDPNEGCENVMQPQGSPYYSNGHNPAGGYYEGARPGAELLIAKQNALAAHTQLWQNTMKRPFYYSESPHYTSPPLLHRYEDISRILQ